MSSVAVLAALERSWWNAELPYVRRTPRELLCILTGLSILVLELRDPVGSRDIHRLNVGLSTIGTALFAARFHLARIMATAGGVGAASQWWIARPGAFELPLFTDFRAYACLATILVLASPDLVQRYDRQQSFGWWPNPWAELGRFELAALRWSVYGMAALGALIFKGYGSFMNLEVAGSLGWMTTYLYLMGAVGIGGFVGLRWTILTLPLANGWVFWQLMQGSVGLFDPARAAVFESLYKIKQQSLAGLPPIFYFHPNLIRPGRYIVLGIVVLSSYLAIQLLRGRLGPPPEYPDAPS